MPGITNYSINKIAMWAEIPGFSLEVTRVEIRYYLNCIPECTIQCAVGRDVKSLTPAPTHGVIDQLKTTVPITVWCLGSEVANSGVSGGVWPAGPFVLFDGQIVGTGSRRSRNGSATLTLFCRHFTMGLEYSWAPTNATHPINPGNFAMGAGIRLNQGNPNFIVSTLAAKYFNTGNIQADYWTESLRPWLTDICQQKQIYFNEAIDQGNDDAIVALSRMESAGRFGVPLSMDNFDILGTRPGIMALINDASNETVRSFTGTTMWEKVVQDFGGRYLFSVVPMANRAIIAPVIPGMRSTWATIDPNQYDAGAINGHLPRPLRGLCLQTGPNSMTGAFGFQRGQGMAIRSIGGLYENPNMTKGMIAFRDAPSWIANAVSQMPWARNAVPVNNPIGNAFVGPRGAAPNFPAPIELRRQAKTLWDEYAKALYLFEVFKGRRGSVSGRIRFDIAPGSSVQLNIDEEKFIVLSGFSGPQTLYGTVTGVTTCVDSDAVQGYTAIEIGWLRDEAENDDDALTTDVHPLFSAPFVGAPLVEELRADVPPEVEE